MFSANEGSPSRSTPHIALRTPTGFPDEEVAYSPDNSVGFASARQSLSGGSVDGRSRRSSSLSSRLPPDLRALSESGPLAKSMPTAEIEPAGTTVGRVSVMGPDEEIHVQVRADGWLMRNRRHASERSDSPGMAEFSTPPELAIGSPETEAMRGRGRLSYQGGNLVGMQLGVFADNTRHQPDNAGRSLNYAEMVTFIANRMRRAGASRSRTRSDAISEAEAARTASMDPATEEGRAGLTAKFEDMRASVEDEASKPPHHVLQSILDGKLIEPREKRTASEVYWEHILFRMIGGDYLELDLKRNYSPDLVFSLIGEVNFVGRGRKAIEVSATWLNHMLATTDYIVFDTIVKQTGELGRVTEYWAYRDDRIHKNQVTDGHDDFLIKDGMFQTKMINYTVDDVEDAETFYNRIGQPMPESLRAALEANRRRALETRDDHSDISID
jgi:hypothetical protein